MSDMVTPLSDDDALEQLQAVVEAALLTGGPLTESTRGYLEYRAVEFGVHRLDAEHIQFITLTLS